MTTDTQERTQEARPLVEWIFGGVSAVIVAGLVLFLGYQALFGEARPAELHVAIERIDRLQNGTAIIVAVANTGDKAASAVIVHASAPDASGGMSQRQIEFDYVGANAVRRGAFVFTDPVAPDALGLEIGGYTEP